MKAKKIFWKEPNRSQAAHLHIASRGQRLSTLTGVDWIDEYRFVVNHQVGLRIAVFDLRAEDNPELIADVPHRSDSVAARKLNKNTWEIVVSGCWEAVSSTYHLVEDGACKLSLANTVRSHDKSFCHGVSFGKNEDLCYAFHTGQNLRVQIGKKAWKLPDPWGPRDVCYCGALDCYFVVAVSHSASFTAYETADTSLWQLDVASGNWKFLQKFDNLHSDSCRIFKDFLLFPDQLSDRVLAQNLTNQGPPFVINGDCFDYPHGVAISTNGILAVTNYGDSSISLIDISEIKGQIPVS